EISRLQGLEESRDEYECVFSPDGLLLAASWRAADKRKPFPRKQPQNGWPVYVCEALTGKVVTEFLVSRPSEAWAWHPGGRLVAVNDGDAIRLWDVRSGKAAKEWKM